MAVSEKEFRESIDIIIKRLEESGCKSTIVSYVPTEADKKRQLELDRFLRELDRFENQDSPRHREILVK